MDAALFLFLVNVAIWFHPSVSAETALGLFQVHRYTEQTNEWAWTELQVSEWWKQK